MSAAPGGVGVETPTPGVRSHVEWSPEELRMLSEGIQRFTATDGINAVMGAVVVADGQQTGVCGGGAATGGRAAA